MYTPDWLSLSHLKVQLAQVENEKKSIYTTIAYKIISILHCKQTKCWESGTGDAQTIITKITNLI